MTGACEVHDSGMGQHPFALDGAALCVRMGWIHATSAAERGPEEMVAVLAGAAVLVCDDDRHPLTAGHGALIPAGAARHWEVDEPVLVYRVQAPQ